MARMAPAGYAGGDGIAALQFACLDVLYSACSFRYPAVATGEMVSTEPARQRLSAGFLFSAPPIPAVAISLLEKCIAWFFLSVARLFSVDWLFSKRRSRKRVLSLRIMRRWWRGCHVRHYTQRRR